MELRDATFVISGAASGLGAATARRLVAGGARVIIGDVNQPAGAALADELGAAARFVRMDVTAEAEVGAAIAAAREHFGAVHGAICCAGIGVAEKLLGRNGPHALDLFTRVIQVNLVGTFNVVRLAAAAMAENAPRGPDGERGVIVMTASVAAFEGQIGQPAYAASKAGVAGMTLPLARELARHGIRVVAIAPGIFDTPMLAGLPEAARQSLAQQVPFPSRLGQPAEYAALVQHIIENPMLNGTVVRLDGALRMAPR
ncbi:SDR family NAD(P)-dependent oxidoreductase [Kallotenue papyrolyticum]|uniref:SDR family NAD(P)-dependent oxidoreductase n=1 Tax=Kallotenue papyrolyticum TaxID=1325125 RepID=UPI0004929B25|nr:SDR family NAD(P)-dependent oxidoreductase [Kallotenue papyrolyticum]